MLKHKTTKPQERKEREGRESEAEKEERKYKNELTTRS